MISDRCNIIATGSAGNAVVLDNLLMIDCGVSFKALNDVWRTLQLVLLTHWHSDHFNYSTIARLARERPALRFGCCDWMAPKLLECGVEKRNIDINAAGYSLRYGVCCCVEPVPLIHNVPNCGYKLGIKGERVFYATDTNSLLDIVAKDFDLYLIEANYEETEIAERIRKKQDAGEFCHEYAVLDYHLSREKAEQWLANNAGTNSRYVFLHGHTDKQQT